MKNNLSVLLFLICIFTLCENRQIEKEDIRENLQYFDEQNQTASKLKNAEQLLKEYRQQYTNKGIEESKLIFEQMMTACEDLTRLMDQREDLVKKKLQSIGDPVIEDVTKKNILQFGFIALPIAFYVGVGVVVGMIAEKMLRDQEENDQKRICDSWKYGCIKGIPKIKIPEENDDPQDIEKKCKYLEIVVTVPKTKYDYWNDDGQQVCVCEEGPAGKTKCSYK